MATYIEKEEKYGKEFDCIIVDKSDPNHTNRVFSICEDLYPLENSKFYRFRVQGVEYHPDITLDESEFLEFVEAVNKIAEKITKSSPNHGH
ncbi:hypothetical protein [uncultured Thiodictyon sp.]|uniref:hypothetical protein n=1 Tax=uncultured Thiodictyon sp. TaxID=1846217 RepID=UPI0025F1EE4F|nr:hypothetical protein [uncultured Thiodictyon sp.]